MDMRTGRTYETLNEALQAGVPPSDLAHVEHAPGESPIVTFANGPFKDRVYRRTRHGLVRMETVR